MFILFVVRELLGICPGPLIVNLTHSGVTGEIWLFIAGYIIGSFISEYVYMAFDMFWTNVVLARFQKATKKQDAKSDMAIDVAVHNPASSMEAGASTPTPDVYYGKHKQGDFLGVMGDKNDEFTKTAPPQQVNADNNGSDGSPTSDYLQDKSKGSSAASI